jgi:uncharacterized protein (TIGR02679 family)
VPEAWSRLRTASWLARLVADSDPHQLIAQASAVLTALPAARMRSDRRTLVPTALHALDDGSLLSGLVLALVNTVGLKRRDAWDAPGIDYDDLTGGLLALGVHPDGWSLPSDAVATIPPRELARCVWPAPPALNEWVFVTENPSVVAAAIALAESPHPPVRLLCTVGTPSVLEATAIAALADKGWRVAIRADFDAAGLAHMGSLLAACPAVVLWRMGAADYVKSTRNAVDTVAPLTVTQTDTSWDPALAHRCAWLRGSVACRVACGSGTRSTAVTYDRWSPIPGSRGLRPTLHRDRRDLHGDGPAVGSGSRGRPQEIFDRHCSDVAAG